MSFKCVVSWVNLQVIQSKIFEIPGQWGMPDFDLAEMYGIKTKVLKQAMRSNMKRFWGEDFCFEFTKKELSRSHKVHDFSVLRSLILCPNLFKNSFSFMIFNGMLKGIALYPRPRVLPRCL